MFRRLLFYLGKAEKEIPLRVGEGADNHFVLYLIYHWLLCQIIETWPAATTREQLGLKPVARCWLFVQQLDSPVACAFYRSAQYTASNEYLYISLRYITRQSARTNMPTAGIYAFNAFQPLHAHIHYYYYYYYYSCVYVNLYIYTPMLALCLADWVNATVCSVAHTQCRGGSISGSISSTNLVLQYSQSHSVQSASFYIFFFFHILFSWFDIG